MGDSIRRAREACTNADRINPGSENPEREYSRRLKPRKEQLIRIRKLHQRLWAYLVVAGVISIAIAYAGLPSHLISPLWILVPCVGIVSIIYSLTSNARTHSRIQRIATFYEMGIARFHHQWQGRGIGGEEFLPVNHVYASDLDVFGGGSLFELLCTARTGIGRATLANWLLNPADCAEVAERQLAVAELREWLDLREHWEWIGESSLDQVASSVSSDWAEAPDVFLSRYSQTLAIALPICLVALLLLGHAGMLGHRWLWLLAPAMAMEGLTSAFWLKKIRAFAANAGLPSLELESLGPFLDCRVAEHFQCRLLKSIQTRVTVSSGRPSKPIRKLILWVWLLNLSQNEYFALPASVILWGTNLAILIERWRQKNRDAVAAWLDSLGRFDALLCLARYSYENPDHSFPVLSPQASALFYAKNLGHPLLDGPTCVRSTIQLSAQGTCLFVVSGSNMSGKSTLLRSIGLNAVLAFAGAPVRADYLRLSPMRIGCSIAIQDSLLQGKSKFQVEVERLKLILDIARTHRVLFLLDEVLAGTNSNDRCYGARAIIEELGARGAIGLITTHDLTVTKIVDALDGRAINVHFQERYDNGEMRFDYVMRCGVLARTNGVNVIAALGLLAKPTN